MDVPLTPDQLRTIVSALGFECDRLNRIAHSLRGTPNFHRPAFLRAGACSDLRDRLRHVMKHGTGLRRVGARFGCGGRKPAEANP